MTRYDRARTGMAHDVASVAPVTWDDESAGVRDVDGSIVPTSDEAGRAEYLRRRGRRVVRHHGRFWQQTPRGFYRPVHPLARFSAEEATRPTVVCWGFSACLTTADADRADAATPMHIASGLDGFAEEALPASRRYKLRKARRRARLVQLTGPRLLRDQGYDVLRSAHRRTGYGSLPTRQQYLATLDCFGEPANGIVLAGLVDGRLAGYLTGFAVDTTAYVGELIIASEALDTQVGTGLTYEFLSACRRTPGLDTVVHGLHVREDEGLCRYKEWLGLPVVRVPSRAWLLPGAAAVVRRGRPHQFYRLTGRE